MDIESCSFALDLLIFDEVDSDFGIDRLIIKVLKSNAKFRSS